jgi:hypothetical protein
VKGVTPPLFDQLLDKLKADFPTDAGLDAVLGPDVSLVPAPKSAPLTKDALWPGKKIAEGLVSRGLGRDVLALVERKERIKKSAYSSPGERPTPGEHYPTLAFVPELVNPRRITIIDDVVTKGATLLAIYRLLREQFPNAQISAFALVRTLGLQPEIERILDPCLGTIRGSDYSAHREP